MSRHEAPLHRFGPTNGGILGWVGVVLAVVVAVFVAVTDPSLIGLRVVLGLAVMALLIWVALLRPRAIAHRDTLVLRNMLFDTIIPLAVIDRVVVSHSLVVWVDEERHSCPGIGRSTRSMMRAQAGKGPTASDDYPDFVESTIEDLARSARRDRGGEDGRVRRAWAVPELVALGLLSVAVLVSLAVR